MLRHSLFASLALMTSVPVPSTLFLPLFSPVDGQDAKI